MAQTAQNRNRTGNAEWIIQRLILSSFQFSGDGMTTFLT